MIRRPPRSTLFPYRRSSDLNLNTPFNYIKAGSGTAVLLAPGTAPFGWFIDARSEEHTSELQSQSNLVCRLLLEKKKTLHPSYTPHAKSDGLHPLAHAARDAT